MEERIRLGYVKEFFRGMDLRSWVANQDMTSDDPVVQRDVQRWLHGIAHSLTPNSVQYNIHRRLSGDKAYPDCPWVCEYTSHMYDQVYAIAIGYGKTEEEAVVNVKKMMKDNIEKYYVPLEEKRPEHHFDEAKFIAEIEAEHNEEEKNNA